MTRLMPVFYSKFDTPYEKNFEREKFILYVKETFIKYKSHSLKKN
jgi:hypothetical protein